MRIKPPSGGAAPPTPVSPATSASEVASTRSAAAASEVAPTSAVAGSGATEPVAEVARRLRAGELSAREAVELLIDDAVDRQIGRALEDRSELKRELKELLRRYTETDPYLAAKAKRLERQK